MVGASAPVLIWFVLFSLIELIFEMTLMKLLVMFRIPTFLKVTGTKSLKDSLKMVLVGCKLPALEVAYILKVVARCLAHVLMKSKSPIA